MSAVEEWVKDKPKEFALFAKQSALGAEAMCKIAELFYDTGTYSKLLTFPSLEEWYGYYKNHRETSSFLTEMFSAFYPSKTAVFSQIDKVLQSQQTTSNDNSHELTELLNEHGEEFYQLSFDEVISDFSIENLPKEEQEKHVEIFSNPKMNFFVNIYIVCNGIYGEEPGFLLRKARLGDVDALEKILRLDERMISEPRIARQVFKLQAEGKRAQFLKLLECTGKRPKLKFTLLSIKYLRAGQIFAMADHLGVKLTAPEVRALFNAISKDSGRGLEDRDLLHVEDEAFRKAVRSKRAFWRKQFDRDKK